MSRSQLPNQEQTHNIDEVITETQEEYDQLEKISDPEPRIVELYPRQSESKIYDDGELVEALSSPSPEPFRRNLALEFEETLAENTQDLNQDEAKQLFENLGMKKLIISPCNSSFSVQISYDDEEALETNKNQDESLSFEEQQPGHYTVRSRAGGLTQRNIAEDLPEIRNNPFIKEISNYEVCSDSEVSRTENMTPSEDNVRENTNKKFDCLSKSFEEIEYKNRLLILTDTSKLFEFLGESGQAAITKEFLWKYIFYLQEHISANKEVYERKISELQQEVTQKDSLLHELMKKQQKVDLNAEMKYYENLQLAHNPRKLIAKLKIAHLGQENKDINSEKYNSGPKAILELSNVKTNHRYNLASSYASLPKKSPTNATLENFRRLKLPLLDVSTNQSLESLDEQAELNFTGKYYGGEPEAFFSTGESHSSVSIKHGEDEVIFSSQDNFKTYFNNLQETLEVMKENNCLIQAENLQLKECIKSLRDETATLKKENERIRGQQKSAQKSKDTRNFQPVGGASLKWANTKKFHELEQQNKHSLERFKSFSITAKSIKV